MSSGMSRDERRVPKWGSETIVGDFEPNALRLRRQYRRSLHPLMGCHI